jgi:hypothetical protein
MTCGENPIPATFAPPALLDLIVVCPNLFAVNVGTLTFGWLLLNDIVHRNQMMSVMGFTAANWTISAGRPRRRKRPTGVRPMPKCLRMLSGSSLRLTSARPSECRCVLSNNRPGHRSAILVPVDTLPGMHHQRNRPADARASPLRAVTSLIPALSRRSCRANAPFAKLVRLYRTSVADEMREEHRRRVLGD